MTTFLRRTIVRLAAGGFLALLVFGIPAMLIYGIGNPMPPGVGAWHEQLLALLNQPPTGRTLLGLVAVLLWVLWAAFTLSLANELLQAARHGLRRDRHSIGSLRTTALVLLTAVTTGTLATTAAAVSSGVQPLDHGLHQLSPPAATAPADPTTHTPAAADAAQDRPELTSTRPDLWDEQTTSPPAVTTADHELVTVQVAHQRYTVEVTKGDTLWDLANTWLGDPFRWPEIYQLNRDRYDHDGRMQGGHHIEPTWILVLPDDATPPADAHPTPAAPDHDADQADEPDEPEQAAEADTVPPAYKPHLPDHLLDPAPSPAASHPSAAPEPTPDDVWAEPESPLVPTPAASSPALPSTPAGVPDAAADQAADDDDDHLAPGEQGGITLPGGWVTLALGASLAAAAVAVWHRRRHRWTPPPDRMPHPGPAGPPLPAAVTRLRQAVRQQAPDMLDPQPPPQPTVREAATADTPPAAPPIGPDGPQLAGLGTLAPAGTALTGPGATAAARALLVATLSAGGPHDPDARGEIITPASILADLLDGPATVDLTGTIGRLTVTDGFAHALNLLEEHILTRHRLLADRDTPDLATLHATDPHHEPMPPLLLIAETPDASWSARLATALHLGEPVAAGAVLLGNWPTGHTLHVAADGTTNQPEQRISVLDAATTVDMLTMLREAHTGHPATSEAAVDHPSPESGADVALAPNQPDPQDNGAPAAPTASPQPADAPPGPRVKVDILGNAAVYDTTGQPITGLRSAALALLIYLAIHRDGANIPDIQEALTPHATLRRAAQRLSTNVGNLRTQLRRAAGIAPNQTSDFKPVINTGGRYHLNPACLDIDWWRLLDAAHRANQTTDPATRLAALEQAVGEWNGGIYDDKYDWIERHQHTCRRYGITIHTQLAELLADTDPQRAAELLETACDIDPLNEDVARQAMRAHARLGDIAAIRERYTRLVECTEAIDEDPSNDTVNLFDGLLREVRSAIHPPAD